MATYCDWNTSPGLSVRILLGTLSVLRIVGGHMLASIWGMVMCWRWFSVMTQRISMSTAAVSSSELFILVVVGSPGYHLVEFLLSTFP